MITQQGLGYYERGTTVLREQVAAVGIALDIVPLEFSAMVARLLACDYDAIYTRPLTTDLDPAGNLDYWLSSGSAHLWNMNQEAPATEWEKQIDTLMHEQSTTLDLQRRQQIFAEVQKVSCRERSRSLFRLAATVLRTQPPPARCRALDFAPTGAVERRFVQRDEPSLMARFLVRRLFFALVLIAVTSSSALLLARLAPGDMTSQLGPFASPNDVREHAEHASIWTGVRRRIGGCGSRAQHGSTSATRSSTTGRWLRSWLGRRRTRRFSGSCRS